MTRRQNTLPSLQSQAPRRLGRDEFNQPTLKVAKQLIGKFIVRRQGRRVLCGMITEVEAYRGPRDRAAHSFGGRRTARVEPLYGEGGTVYVYLIYGMHWMLNFSTAGREVPEGILIRGILTSPENARKYLAGPGRVTQYFEIGKNLDRADAATSTQIWIEDRGVRVPTKAIQRGPRIGVDFAGAYWAARPWRMWIDAAIASQVAAGP